MIDIWKGDRVELRAVAYQAPPPADQCLCDASFARPTRFPHRGIMTYTSNDGRKVASQTELKAWLDAGKEIGWVKQDGKVDALGGAAVGKLKAEEANAHLDRVGAPDWVPVAYVAQDSGLTSGQYPAVADFFRGVFSVTSGRPVGRYGGGNVFRFLDGEFGPDAFALNWMAAATSWGIYAGAHLRQMPGAPWYPIPGVPTDDDLILRDFARWGMPAPSSLTDADRVLLRNAASDLTATARILS